MSLSFISVNCLHLEEQFSCPNYNTPSSYLRFFVCSGYDSEWLKTNTLDYSPLLPVADLQRLFGEGGGNGTQSYGKYIVFLNKFLQNQGLGRQWPFPPPGFATDCCNYTSLRLYSALPVARSGIRSSAQTEGQTGT